MLVSALNASGFDAFIGDEHSPCDVVVADQPMNLNKPVVVYSNQQNLGAEIIKASVTKLYTPLRELVNKTLEIIRTK